jgi:hypothetical protein
MNHAKNYKNQIKTQGELDFLSFFEKLPQFFEVTEEVGKAGGDSQKRNDRGSLNNF